MLQNQRFYHLTVSLWLLSCVAAYAQDVPPADVPKGTPPPITSERISEFQKSVSESTELTDEEKKQIGDLIQTASADLKAADAADAQARNFEQLAGGVETTRAKLEKDVAQPPEPATLAPNRPIADLETERVDVQTRITQLEQDLKRPNVDLAARTASRKAARDALTDLPARLSDLKQQLAATAPEGEQPLLTQARQLALEAQQWATQARLTAAQKELALYDAADAVNLPTMRREVMTRELNAKQKRLEALNAEINLQRQREAQRRAMEAEQEAMNAQPLLKKELEKNQEIARTEQEVRVQHEDAKTLLQQVADRLKVVTDDFEEARKLEANVGLDKRGPWLRQQRDSLDDLPALDEKVSRRTERTTDVLFDLYERDNQLNQLASLEDVADKLTAEAQRTGDVDGANFRDKAIQVLRSQSVNLRKLIDEYAAYTDTLDELAQKQLELQKEAFDYADFLDERVLWVRSDPPISLSTLHGFRDFARLLLRATWATAAKAIGWDASDHLLMYGSVGLLVLFLLMGRRRHGRQLRDVADRASGRVNVSIAPTVHCLVLTIWLAIVWPGLILFLAWRLRESSISSDALKLAAINLARLASVFFLMEFLRQSVRPYGLAEAHFGWNTKTLRRVRRLLWSVMVFGLPIAVLVACLHQQDNRDDVERLLFVASMVVLAALAHGLLHPQRGALWQMKALQNSGWIERLDRLWYLIAMSVPMGLAILAYLGYYDTAVRLALKVQRTAWLLVAAVYLQAFSSRWLMLRHRRLRIEKARERLAANQDVATNMSESGVPVPDAEQDRADLDESSDQTQRLMRVMIVVACLAGLWLVWADVLPAIRFLDRWPIWETTVQTVENVTNETTGTTETRPKIEVRAVTIASLVQVLVIILLTTTAARNVPGLLEMSVLARLPIDRSTSYAITSLTRYGLVLIGLILASKALGLTWANVQWLAAALTFGLGFGLQEIFANFVSGLIILFEQPVRVGDVVTIEGVSGVVNRIRIRATTIVDWDRKEYIVPNREFITGRLLNWTLSDKMNRLSINFGVAYGSNISQVRAIIMEAVQAHPNVLSDPSPIVTFESFGQSSLDFVVRAYLPNLDNRLQTIHDLHSEIYDRLAAAGIEIPFPQRDLHLRTSVTLEDSNRRSVATNGQAEIPSKSPESLT